MATREEIFARIRVAGLGRLQHPLETALRDAIRVTCVSAPNVMDLGGSRIGGKPDLPLGERWPERRSGRPLAFLAQFRMVEVARCNAGGLLPGNGMMYFFYDAEEQPWGDSAERDGWKVICNEDQAAVLERRDPPPSLRDDCRFAPRAVRLSTETTLPSYDSYFVKEFGLRDEEIEAYTDVLGEFDKGESGRHRLLGHPDEIQNEMESECERESRAPYYSSSPDSKRVELAQRAKQWRLLFQLDSDDDAGMMWGDVGRLYFWIQEGSLGAKNWDAVWLVLQCY